MASGRLIPGKRPMANKAELSFVKKKRMGKGGSVRTQNTVEEAHRKWRKSLSKWAKRGDKERQKVPFWCGSGETLHLLSSRVLSSDRTRRHRSRVLGNTVPFYRSDSRPGMRSPQQKLRHSTALSTSLLLLLFFLSSFFFTNSSILSISWQYLLPLPFCK